MEQRQRYLQEVIVADALSARKIAFVVGPRQAGKTVLAEAILAQHGQGENYYTWDDDEFRLLWLKNPKMIMEKKPAPEMVVLDEIHKHRAWKTKLKGIYDLYKNQCRFIVTGSARLEFYRKSGDSLQGRYFPYRLHPFSAGEQPVLKPPPRHEWSENTGTSCEVSSLLTLGGFPEPYLGQSEAKAARWRRLHRERMIFQDLRDIQNVHDLQIIDSLALLLQHGVGSKLSYESLRQDLRTSFDSIKRWVGLLEAVYYCYRIQPYTRNVKRAILKEPKLYLYDWAGIEDEGARWENLIAGHLLKSCHAWTDCAMGEFQLHYVRDKQKREVDFLVTNKGKPYLLAEVKSGRAEPTESLKYFQRLLQPQFAIQIVKEKRQERRRSLAHPNIEIMTGERFLAGLN